MAPLLAQFAGQKLAVWFVGVGEDPENLAIFARELGVTVPVLLDADGSALRHFLPSDVAVDAPLPVAMNVLIDSQGHVILRSLRDDPSFDPTLADVQKLLQQQP